MTPGNSRGHSQTPSSQRSSRIPRHCSIPSSSQLAITNTSPLTQRGLLVPLRQPSSAFFQEAENVVVHDGQFTSGNVHISINLPEQTENRLGGERRPPLVQPTLMDRDGESSDEVTITESRLLTSGDGDTVTPGSSSTPRSFLATKTSNEVYETLLAPKKRGYALWIPEPNKNLPFPYQRKGIQIGDVGIITPDGNFSFIFNICVPRDDPINPPSLFEEFAPVHPPIDPIDVRKLAVFKANSYLASTSIEKFQDDTTSPGLSFRASASEGAILTMPDGAVSQDLENLPRFREYVAANVERWYKYINGPRGREAKNGDVRLVVGCDKATSWGIATLTGMTQHSQLKFKPLDPQSSSSRSCGYTWEYSGTAEARAGPDQEEIDELRREDADDTQNKYLNQCLFVRTLNATLDDGDWESLNHEIGIGCVPNSSTEHGTGIRDPSSIPQPTSSISGNFGTQRRADGSAMEFTSPGRTITRLTISVPPTTTSCHPSRIINEVLLKMIPSAKMVITHDEDWYSCIQKDMTMSSDPEQILASLLSVNDIQEDNGVVYLEPKVSREMKYFADLEQLSIELKTKSSTLEKYLYGVEPDRSARWNEIVFLLELCRDTLSASANDMDTTHKSLPDAQRIREMEYLIGSLLVDELFLDKPDAFEFIYSLRPLSSEIKPSSSDFRLDTFRKLSSFLGRDSTGMEYLNPPIKLWKYEQNFTTKIDSRGSRRLLALSSCFYLLYLALGELADLKHTIEIFRQQELPERMSFHSSDIPSPEEVITPVSPPCPMGNTMSIAIGEGLHNSNLTRSDYRLHAQIAARMNDDQNLRVSSPGHQPPRPLSPILSGSRDRGTDQPAINTPSSYSATSAPPLTMSANPGQPSVRPFTTPILSADDSSMVARQWGVFRNAVGFTGRMKSILSRSDGGRRRKALLIGINYDNTTEVPLSFPQSDTKKMRRLLQETFEFLDNEITTITDEEGASLLPTQETIMQEVSRFIIRGQDNTDYVLFYSGHSGQHPELDSDKVDEPEEDGKSEFIIPQDVQKDKDNYLPDSVIYDTYLHEQIIKPLEKTKGCHLFAVFGSCHSATLLNLKHHRCNRVGTGESAFRRFVRHYIIEDVVIPFLKRFPRKLRESGSASRPQKCNGYCPRNLKSSRRSTMMICISGSKDHEVAVEHGTLETFASVLINFLEEKPDTSLKDGIYTASEAEERVHNTLKEHLKLGDPTLPPELDMARWNPQLSSNVPLDTNASLMYKRVATENYDSRGRIKRSTLDYFRHFNPYKVAKSRVSSSGESISPIPGSS